MSRAKKQEPQHGLLPSEWEAIFRRAKVRVESLEEAKSLRARATHIGNYLAQNLDREVPIQVNGRTGKARLRFLEAGRKQRRYFFEVEWDDELQLDASAPVVPPPPQSPAQMRRSKLKRKRKPRETRPARTPARSNPQSSVKPTRDNKSGNSEDWT